MVYVYHGALVYQSQCKPHELAYAHVSSISNDWYCSNPWCGRDIFQLIDFTFSLSLNQWLPSCFNCLGSDVTANKELKDKITLNRSRYWRKLCCRVMWKVVGPDILTSRKLVCLQDPGGVEARDRKLAAAPHKKLQRGKKTVAIGWRVVWMNR